jgi:hypothetical protein
MALSTGFSSPCLIAVCRVACFLASTAIFWFNSDLPEQVAGGPAATAVVGSLAATASAPAAQSIHCQTASRVAAARAAVVTPCNCCT